MANSSFRIRVNFRGTDYEGWVRPSEKDRIDGQPKSFHVVLNDLYFGNLSRTNRVWTVDEQRPQELVELVGSYIESQYE